MKHKFVDREKHEYTFIGLFNNGYTVVIVGFDKSGIIESFPKEDVIFLKEE